MARILSLITEEKGIQHAEEALLLALLAVALTALVTGLKNNIGSVFTDAGAEMTAPTT